MGKREQPWEGERLLVLSVPPAIKAILARWAEPCDPAPLGPPGADSAALCGIYLTLARRGPPLLVTRALLATLRGNARFNADYAMWADLRGEARTVCAWLEPDPGRIPDRRAH